MKKIKILNVIVFIIFSLSCENRTYIEILKKEYIPKELEGGIDSIELWKGSILSLQIKNKSKIEKISVHTDYKILMQIRKGDYFKKIANSNKCIIKRGDSIINIDCNQFTDEERDSLGKIQEWKPEEKNSWRLSKTDK